MLAFLEPIVETSGFAVYLALFVPFVETYAFCMYSAFSPRPLAG
jgi:hypothetical protein